MNNIDFTLCQESIKNIPFQKYENDFTFIVNGKRYQTNRFVADILSPNIKKLHFTDTTVNEYHIKTKNNKDEETNETDYFQDFLSLAYFQNTKLDLIHQKYYSDYFYQLGNIVEYIRILQNQEQEEAADNVINKLLSIISVEEKSNKTIELDQESIKKSISYIANHFEEVKEKIKKLGTDMLCEIFQNEDFQLNSEDSLLEFILALYKEDYSYSVLFEYVIFNNVSESLLEDFVNDIEFKDINYSIWNAICSRLSKSKQIKANPKRYKSDSIDQKIEFKQTKGNFFNGVFNYLTNEYGENIHDKGIVEISSDSIYKDSHPKNLVNYREKTFSYVSLINQSATVTFDFKDKKVQPSSYVIKTSTLSYAHIKSWVIEASVDDENWVVIDEHKNDPSLNSPSAVASFNVKQTNSFYRYIRIRKTGPAWGVYNYINLVNFEIYGKLLFPKKVKY